MKNSDAVSENQLFYVVTIELFCLISLFLPGFLSGDLKQDSIIGLIVGFGFACIFAWLLSMFCARYGNVFLKADKKSGVIMDIFRFILFIQTILITVFVLNITWEIVQMFLLPDVNKTVILVSFYMVCIFASLKDISVRARAAEFCGRFFALLLVILLILSLRKIDLNQYEMLLLQPVGKIINGGYEVFLLFESIVFSLFAASALNKKSYAKAVKKSLYFSIIFGIIMLTVLMGTFGVDYIAVMDFPAIRLLRNLTQNGGFLSRMDVLMTGIWLFSLFFFASGGIQYSRLLLKSVMEESASESLNIVLIVVIFVVTIIFGNMQNSYYIYRSYMYYIGTPAIVLTLIILLIKKDRGLKIEKK